MGRRAAGWWRQWVSSSCHPFLPLAISDLACIVPTSNVLKLRHEDCNRLVQDADYLDLLPAPASSSQARHATPQSPQRMTEHLPIRTEPLSIAFDPMDLILPWNKHLTTDDVTQHSQALGGRSVSGNDSQHNEERKAAFRRRPSNKPLMGNAL